MDRYPADAAQTAELQFQADNIFQDLDRRDWPDVAAEACVTVEEGGDLTDIVRAHALDRYASAVDPEVGLWILGAVLCPDLVAATSKQAG